MQKLIRRTALARNQAKRRAILDAKAAEREDRRTALRERFAYDRSEIDRVRTDRKNRHEDWARGPLAPRRDAGLGGKSFGAISPESMNLPKVPEHLRRKYINIAPGDRVVVIKGRDKGKISEVTRVDSESESVTLKDLNMVDVAFPDWLNKQYGGNTPFRALPLPMPMDDVRLVVALRDPMTNRARDYVVKHVYGGGPILEREYGVDTPRHTRYIAGENIEIPWPRSEVTPQRDGPLDTLRKEVETPTWIPSLEHPPFPSSIMDELRNKYSQYRTRHDPEFVKAKKMEEYKKEYYANISLMTPRGELRAMKMAKRKESLDAKRDAEGNMIMLPRTADFIQNFMEKNGRGRQSST